MVTAFYPPHIGGIEYHVETLSKYLSNEGHKIAVLTSCYSDKTTLYHQKSNNIEVFKLKAIYPSGLLYSSLSSQAFTFYTRKAIEYIVEKQKIDIIHVHGHHYYLTLRTIDIARDLKIPSVLTLHGLYALDPPKLIAQRTEEIFNHTLFRRALSKVNAVIGLTPKVTNYARRYGPSSRVYFTIPNGVDFHIFNRNRKNRVKYQRKYQISERKKIVLFRGRFSSVKGVLELAEAAKLVLQKDNSFYFVFVGDGPLAEKLSEILKSIKANSKIINWTPADKIYEIYIASDLFILPSKSEALPLTILEAMAAQLPIITTRVGGIPEVLENYPFKSYLNRLSPLEICNKIIEAFSSPQYACAVTPTQILPRYLEPFDWNNICFQVIEIYQNIQKAAPNNRSSNARMITS
jgi:glycosyltransferase involved in cell wall biosynthesis